MRFHDLAFVFAFSLAACGSDDPDLPEPPADLYIPEGYTLTPYLSDEPVRQFAAAELAIEIGKDYLAVIETEAGRLVLDLHEVDTPKTVNSFVWLARHHFFDGIAFHRVLDGFVAQAGDPNTLSGDRGSWGSGGPGYQFGLEIVSSLKYDAEGVVGMARTSQPDTNGSQFFITLGPVPSLNNQYTIFARVIDGLPVLGQIARGEPPSVPTRMSRVHIVEKKL